MPHRFEELDRILMGLAEMAQSATEINELQLANAIVGAVKVGRESRDRIRETSPAKPDLAEPP